MHEGGWEPFVHHFSSVLGDVVPQDEETRASDVLPVNRTMKKYKICVTIILNFLLVIF